MRWSLDTRHYKVQARKWYWTQELGLHVSLLLTRLRIGVSKLIFVQIKIWALSVQLERWGKSKPRDSNLLSKNRPIQFKLWSNWVFCSFGSWTRYWNPQLLSSFKDSPSISLTMFLTSFPTSCFSKSTIIMVGSGHPADLRLIQEGLSSTMFPTSKLL